MNARISERTMRRVRRAGTSSIAVAAALGFLVLLAPAAEPPQSPPPQSDAVPSQASDSPSKARGAKAVASDRSAARSEKRSLDEVLAATLRNNPEIAAAAAKVRLAEAELKMVRMAVVQQVIDCYYAIQAQEQKIAQLKVRPAPAILAKLLDLTTRSREGGIDEKTFGAQREALVAEHEQQLASAETELAKLQRKLDALSGKLAPASQASISQGDSEMGGYGSFSDEFSDAFGVPDTSDGSRAAAPANPSLAAPSNIAMGQAVRRNQTIIVPPDVDPATAKKLQQQLETTIVVDFDKLPLSDACEWLREQTGVLFIVQPTLELGDGGPKISLKVGELTLRAALQAISDFAMVQFIARDYGVLVAPRGYADTMGMGAGGFSVAPGTFGGPGDAGMSGGLGGGFGGGGFF